MVHDVPGAPDPVPLYCVRCSKPITSGTASQYAGRPLHMRCLARDTQLESIEQQDRATYERLRAHAAMIKAGELMAVARQTRAGCPVCGEALATSRGVLFQGDQLVHAACWRADPKPFDDPPPAE
jgi:hypothetical protein